MLVIAIISHYMQPLLMGIGRLEKEREKEKIDPTILKVLGS